MNPMEPKQCKFDSKCKLRDDPAHNRKFSHPVTLNRALMCFRCRKEGHKAADCTGELVPRQAPPRLSTAQMQAYANEPKKRRCDMTAEERKLSNFANSVNKKVLASGKMPEIRAPKPLSLADAEFYTEYSGKRHRGPKKTIPLDKVRSENRWAQLQARVKRCEESGVDPFPTAEAWKGKDPSVFVKNEVCNPKRKAQGLRRWEEWDDESRETHTEEMMCRDDREADCLFETDEEDEEAGPPPVVKSSNVPEPEVVRPRLLGGGSTTANATSARERRPAPFPTVRKWAQSLRLPVRDSDGTLRMAAELWGVPVAHVETRMIDPHPLSRIRRFQALLTMLIDVGGSVTTLRIVDYYPSQRELRYVPSAEAGVSVNWVSTPGIIHAGDGARNTIVGIPLPPDGTYLGDVGWIFDVYHLTPGQVFEVARATTRGVVYVGVRDFRGYAGADPQVKVGEGPKAHTFPIEGVWWRDPEGQIVFSSDAEMGTSYARHPSVDWLFTHVQLGGLAISRAFTCGPYTVFRVVVQLGHADVALPTEIPTITRVLILDSSWMAKCTRWLPTWFPHQWRARDHEFVVHHATFCKLNLQSVTRVAHGATVDTVIGQVATEFNKLPLLVALSRRYPLVWGRVQRDTAMAVLHHGRLEASTQLLNLRVEGGNAERALLSARAMATPAGALPARWPWLVALAVGVTLVMWKRKGTWRGLLGSWVGLRFDKALADMKIRGAIIPGLDPQIYVPALTGGLLERYVLTPTPASLIRALPMGEPDPAVAFLAGLPLEGLMRVFLTTPQFWLEEGVKQWCPYWVNLAIWTAEAGLYVLHGASPQQRSLVFVAHMLLMCVHKLFPILAPGRIGISLRGILVFGFALLEHAKWNTIAIASHRPLGWFRLVALALAVLPFLRWLSRTRHKTVFEAFREAYVGQTDLSLIPSGVTNLPGVEIVDSVEPTLQQSPPWDELRGEMTITIGATERTVEEAFREFPVEKPDPVYLVAANCGLPYRPSKGPRSALTAILLRTMSDPYDSGIGASTVSQRNGFQRLLQESFVYRWRMSAITLPWTTLIPMKGLEEPATLAVFVRKLAPQKRAVFEGAVKSLQWGTPLAKLKFMPKSDEVLALKEMSHGKSIKPRAIVVFDPQMGPLMGPVVETIAVKMHEHWTGERVHRFDDVPMRLVFASGSTPAELNVLARVLRDSSESVIAFAGDDTILKICTGDSQFYLESDLAQCDQTLGAGPHEVFLPWFFERVGLPMELWQLLIDAKTRPVQYVSKKSGIRIKVTNLPMMMDTGSQITTLATSAVVCAAFATAVKQFVQAAVPMETTLQNLGLKPKMKVWPTLFGATFLRGTFFHNHEGELGWYPIPNCAKWGKFLTSPLEMVKAQGGSVTEMQAVKTLLLATALSVKIPDNMPVMGAYRRALFRCTRGVEVSQQLVERIRTIRQYRRSDSAHFASVDRSEVLQFIEMRYNVSAVDVSEAEELLNNISSVPFFVSHPVFRVMAEVDYG